MARQPRIEYPGALYHVRPWDARTEKIPESSTVGLSATKKHDRFPTPRLEVREFPRDDVPPRPHRACQWPLPRWPRSAGLVKLSYPLNCRSVFAFGRSLARLPVMKFVATLDRDEDGIWISECPAIPGCVSQGSTRDEALANIREAIALCLEVRAERGLPLTIETRQIEVTV